MRLVLLTASLLACLSAPVLAQDVTCYDGTRVRGGQGAACSRHGGLQPAAADAPAAGGRAANPTTDASTPQADTRTRPRATRGPQAQQAPGGGPGMVWVNASSKAYHCPSDRYYGRTKRGSYMTEPAAKAAGAHPSDGKACS